MSVNVETLQLLERFIDYDYKGDHLESVEIVVKNKYVDDRSSIRRYKFFEDDLKEITFDIAEYNNFRYR